MVTCPRCSQQVDETTRATCPHCFTPLAAAPQPGAPQPGQSAPGQPYPGAPAQAPQPPQSYAQPGSRSGNTRVSLTGEVIESNAPSSPPPSYVGGAGGGRPVGPAASRPASSAARMEAPAKSGGGAITVILILLVLAIGGGGAAWWFMTPHVSPKAVVEQFDKAFAAQDWKTVYTLVELSPDLKTKYKDASAFATDMSSQINQARSMPMIGGAIDAFIKSYETATVGEATINGDTATVPITLKVSADIMGQHVERSMDKQVPLRKVGNTWKIDGMAGAMPTGVPGMK